jgi:uncharacterized protein (TIGR03790 family)
MGRALRRGGLALAACALAACANEGERALIIVNQNSPVSVAIGERYAERRDVPEQNILALPIETNDPTLTTADHETISREGYEAQIRDPIASYLRGRDDADEIDFLITTKGIPLRVAGVRGGTPRDWLRNATVASVDSELMLLFTDSDGLAGPVANPFYQSDLSFQDFRRARPHEAPRFLVARLTGPLASTDDPGAVPEAIERLLRIAQDPAEENPWLIDADSGHKGAYAAADRTLLDAAASTLRARGLPVQYDQDAAFIGATELDEAAPPPQRLQGYASWGSNDRSDAGPPFYGRIGATLYPGRFGPRSVAIDFVSTSARTFTAPPSYGQSLISDLLALGAGGVGGHVDEPTLATVHRPHLLFERYAAGTAAVEAYWASVPVLGWMHVWVGDPLMRLAAASGEATPDRDGDGIVDGEDNCTHIPNPRQRDTDSDGYGNRCDADINNDGLVSTSWGSTYPLGERGDLEWIGLTVHSEIYDENHDLNGDGQVDAVDLSIAQLGLYQAPGPSGLRP